MNICLSNLKVTESWEAQLTLLIKLLEAQCMNLGTGRVQLAQPNGDLSGQAGKGVGPQVVSGPAPLPIRVLGADQGQGQPGKGGGRSGPGSGWLTATVRVIDTSCSGCSTISVTRLLYIYQLEA